MNATTSTNPYHRILDKIGNAQFEGEIAPNTIAKRVDLGEDFRVFLHGHHIATVTAWGDVALYTDHGYVTKTTAARMNMVLAGTGWHVSRKGGRFIANHPEAVGGPWFVENGTILCPNAIACGLGEEA